MRLKRIGSLWRTLFRKAHLDRDLDDELASYVDELIERKVRGGIDPAVARREALVETGGLEQVKEQVRMARVGGRIDTALADVRYALRGLRRAPGFTTIAVLTLSLGIGATVAIFSVVHAMLIEPLPYRDADRLVIVWSDLTDAGYPRGPLAGPELKDLRERATRFTGFGGIWSNTAALTGDGDPEQLRIGLVTREFFPVLGADAALGRTFTAEDDTPASSATILLTWPLWQRRYARDPHIVGRRVQVNGRPATVIGVMPAGFRLLFPPDASIPDDLQAFLLLNPAYERGPRGQQYIRVIGRLRPGVTLEEGQREIAAIGREVGRQHAEYGPSGWVVYAVGLQNDDMRELRPALVALFGGVTILLLIACVNVAGLLVARAASRRHETALRRALGAGRLRLFRQYVVEGLLLGAFGGAVGVGVGWVGLRGLLTARPEALQRIDAAHLEPAVVAFAAGVALLSSVIFSLAPLTESFRRGVVDALGQGGRRGVTVPSPRARAGLVIVQVALGVVLVVNAGLLVRGLVALQQVDPGFRAGGVLTFRVAPPGSRYQTPAAFVTFVERLQDELSRLPGVDRVGGISHLPYDDLSNWSTPYLKEGETDRRKAREADARAVTPGFFETAGAVLTAGRDFTNADDVTAPPVAIVDERLASRLWPGESAIGRRVLADPRADGAPTVLVTVVGVVRHLRHRTPAEEVREQMYFPERQVLRSPIAWLLRTTVEPATISAAVRAVVGRLDPELPVYDVRPLADYSKAARASPRFTTVLAVMFAAAALALAVVGVYGLIAYSVVRRRHELGIRLALGARPIQIQKLVVGEGLRLATAGLVLGLAAAALAAPLIRALLFGVAPWDVTSYAAGGLLLGLAALAACWLPARRATANNPLEALRIE
jgi:predicted permease